MNKKQRQAAHKARIEKIEAIKQSHEPGIRKLTSQRKDIADKINELRERDKHLAAQVHEKLLARDAELQKFEEDSKVKA